MANIRDPGGYVTQLCNGVLGPSLKPSPNWHHQPRAGSRHVTATSLGSATSFAPVTATAHIPSLTTSQILSLTTSYESGAATSLGPVLVTSHVPGTTASYVPGTTASYVPGTTASYVPGTTASYVPGTTASHVLGSTASHVPGTTISYMPAKTTSHVHSTTTSFGPAKSTSHGAVVAPSQVSVTNMSATTPTSSSRPNRSATDTSRLGFKIRGKTSKIPRRPGWWGARTRLERVLLVLCVLVLFVVVAVCLGMAAVISGYTARNIFTAAKLIANMDEKVDPCHDFFEYACGNYLRTQIIPDEKSSISQFSDVSDALQEKLRTLVEAEDEGNDTKSSLMVKRLYKSCMDIDSIAARGLHPLKEVLHEMGGWPAVEGANWNPNNFDWAKNMYINRKLGYSVDLLFDFSITTNIKNSSWRIIDIDQPPLGMPSRKYLLKGLNDSDVQAYLEYQVSLAELLGADRETATTQLTESLEFEIQIANFSLPKEERRNASKLYNKMTVAELQAFVHNVPWLEYINTILDPFVKVTDDEEVVVNVPSYIEQMGKLLLNTHKRVIANYMMWRVAASSVSYLSEDARNLQLVYSKKITGTGKRQPRWKECMGAVSGSLSHAVGKLYAEKFFKKDAKASADLMVAYIRAEFDKILRTVDWMDDETRVRAINKSLAITPHIAYPEELLIESKLTELYQGLEITDGELLSNMRNLTMFGTDYSFRRLREKVNKNDWKNHGAAAVVNAFYSPLENSIQFPAGILQGTFFDADRPKYLNYGAIGFVIGHEITHGFDDMGRQFDYKGDLQEWWEAETRAKFIDKSKCIIYQYGNYTAPEVDMQLNGVNTQGENIADNGGIKEAYYAYQQWAADNGKEPILPGLHKLTSKQLFWLSAANVWCGKYRPETLKLRILTGAHSPARFRVNGPLSNLNEFSADWNCKVESKMNPANKCTVW